MTKITIKRDLCKACGLCIEVCPKKILKFDKELNKLGYPSIVVSDKDKCIACLRCALICPDSCIEIYKKDK